MAASFDTEVDYILSCSAIGNIRSFTQFLDGESYESGATDASRNGGYVDSIDISAIRDSFAGMAVNARHKDQSTRYANLYSGGLTSQDPNIQFSIGPSSGHSTLAVSQQSTNKIRFGGLLGSIVSVFGNPVQDIFGATLYDQLPGVEANTNVADQFGPGVLKTQGFAKFTQKVPVVVTEFRVLTNKLQQLNKGWSYKTLNPNSIITEDTLSIGATRQKSDDTSDLVVVQGCWLLDAHHWLETSLAIPQ